MKKVNFSKWKGVFVWLCGAVSFVAFAIVGGYALVKEEDESVKKTAKTALFVTLVFAAIKAVLALFGYIGGMFDGYYASVPWKICDILERLVNIARLCVYAFFIVMTFFSKQTPDILEEDSAESKAGKENKSDKEEKNEETKSE